MINIIMYNVKSKIENLNTLPYNVLNNILMSCSYVKKTFGVKPTRKYLIDVKSGITYTGLLSHIVPILKKNGIAYHINDMRVKPEKKYNWRIVNGFTMRDYQKRIVDRIQHTSRMTIFGCTSCGKTFIMANLMIEFGCDCLVIAPKASLSIQLRNEFQEFLGIKVGLINGTCVDHTNNGKKCPVIVGTPQTLKKYQSIVNNASAILFDEVHNLPAKCISDIAFAAKNAYYRIGCSGSPWRDDGQTIIIDAALAPQNPKNRISASELINRHILTPVNINWIKCDSKTGWLGDYNTTYNENIINNDVRNKYVINIAKHHICQNHSTVILYKNIKHGQKLYTGLQQVINNEKFTTEYNGANHTTHTIELISGADSLEQREIILKSVKEGKTKCIIASTILDEGISVSILSTIIFAGGGSSSTRQFQRVGRVIRSYPGKAQANVYDFIDSNDTLYHHSMIRMELMKLEPAFKQKIFNTCPY